MSNRFFELASAAASAAVIGIVFLALAPAAAQTPTAKLLAKESDGRTRPGLRPAHRTASRTSRAVYTNASVIPLERPKDLGAKEFFTKEEADAYADKAMVQHEVVAPGTYGDVHYNMSQFGLEKGQAKVAGDHSHFFDRRTGRAGSPAAAGGQGETWPRARRQTRDMNSMARRIAASPSDASSGRTKGRPCFPRVTTAICRSCRVEGYVAIMQEMIHDVRIIPTDGRPHLPPDVRQLMGDSRGHWEGNTLVVDTTNFTDRTAFRGSSENLHVVERFTRTDPDTVLTSSRSPIRRPGRNPGAARFR